MLEVMLRPSLPPSGGQGRAWETGERGDVSLSPAAGGGEGGEDVEVDEGWGGGGGGGVFELK